MKEIRLGIVGLGHRGRAMAMLSCDAFEYVKLVAVCDKYRRNWFDSETADTREVAFGKDYPDTVFYENYETMLDEAGLDLVIVETGADIHAKFIIKALERNINVLTDIPVVASLEEAEDLWRAAERSTAMISVGANPNEQKFTVFLKDFYKRGLLGEPFAMEAEYIHWWLPGSPVERILNENGEWRKLLSPIRYCTHSLGPLLTILDEPLRKVSCFSCHGRSPVDDYLEADKTDMQSAQFQTDSGVIVRFQRNGRCRAEIGYHNYRVFGSEGYVERIDRFGKPMIRYNSTKEENNALREMTGEYMPPGYENNASISRFHGGMDYVMLLKVYTALREGLPAPISLKEGLAMTIPGIYAEESAKRNGEILRIRYPWDEDWKVDF
ncbi:MAG: Gfo/Idh/MocA family oxidoreductase [Clostridia bacterium]|nr:Gfo/Idh/MocA family oxidoreductase [Clostridia bacterium]